MKPQSFDLDSKDSEDGGSRMKRYQAIDCLRGRVVYAEKIAHIKENSKVYVEMDMDDVRAMKKAIEDMKNIEAMKATFYPKED